MNSLMQMMGALGSGGAAGVDGMSIMMQAVYDILHEQHIEHAGKVKALQTLFLEG